MKRAVIISVVLSMMVVPFLTSAKEYTGTKETIVRDAYEDMFGEKPSWESFTFWVTHFPKAGAQELVNIYSNEYLRFRALEQVYIDMLGRNWPYINGYEFDFHQMHRSEIGAIRKQLAFSNERKMKYSQMYKDYLGREMTNEEWNGRLEKMKSGNYPTIDDLRIELISSTERKNRITELFVRKTGSGPNQIQKDILFDWWNRAKDENKSVENVEKFLDGKKDLKIDYLWSNEEDYCEVVGLVNYGLKDVDVSGYKFKSGKYEFELPNEKSVIGPFQRYYVVPSEYYKDSMNSGYNQCKPGHISYFGIDMDQAPTVDDFEAYSEILENEYDAKGVQLIDKDGNEVSKIDNSISYSPYSW